MISVTSFRVASAVGFRYWKGRERSASKIGVR
jgi:hypothetical protein